MPVRPNTRFIAASVQSKGSKQKKRLMATNQMIRNSTAALKGPGGTASD